MSLINDALKQAKQSQSQTPPSGAPPLPPVETKREPASPWPLIIAAAFFGAAILIFAVTAKHKTVAPVLMTNAPAAAIVQMAPTNAPAPTNALAEAVEQLPKVQGIIYDAAHPLAIVDRKTVRIGDSAGNYKVTAISRTSVTFQRVDGSLAEIKIGKQ